MSPAQFPLHQDAVMAICVALRAACPPDMEIFVGPIGYEVAADTTLQPDVVVMRRADVHLLEPLRKPAVLVVEVLSKSTRKTDLEGKPPAYAISGAAHYWTFDPQELRFVARRRQGVEYVTVAEASGEQRIRLDEPYPVEICPAEIING